jgi:hypothetical protein
VAEPIVRVQVLAWVQGKFTQKSLCLRESLGVRIA